MKLGKLENRNKVVRPELAEETELCFVDESFDYGEVIRSEALINNDFCVSTTQDLPHLLDLEREA